MKSDYLEQIAAEIDAKAADRIGERTHSKAKRKTSYSQKLKVVTMNTVTSKKAKFILPGWLPMGSVSLGYGEGGVGKSTVVLDWAARLTRGEPFHGATNENEPGDVVLILAEDPLEFVVKPRLMAAGADNSKVHAIEAVESISQDGDKFESSINIAQHKALIDEVLSSVANPKPLAAYAARPTSTDRLNHNRNICMTNSWKRTGHAMCPGRNYFTQRLCGTQEPVVGIFNRDFPDRMRLSRSKG